MSEPLANDDSGARGEGPASDGGRGEPSGVAVATSGHAANVAEPWRTDSWEQDRAAALQAVENGTVPDAYRDLIRDYFARTPPARR